MATQQEETTEEKHEETIEKEIDVASIAVVIGIIVSLVTVALSVYNATKPAPPPSFYSETVQVFDSVTSNPVKNAAVQLDSTTDYTDDSGEANFGNVEAGQHSIVVIATGYVIATETTTIENSKTDVVLLTPQT